MMNLSNGPLPLLTFTLGQRRYALAIAQVVEVAAMVAYTPIPESDPALLGLVNRHGDPLPLLDLRVVFGVPALPPGADTFFIVVRALGDAAPAAGLVADHIQGVIYVTPDALRPVPETPGPVRQVASTERDLVQILDIDPILQHHLQQAGTIPPYPENEAAEGF